MAYTRAHSERSQTEGRKCLAWTWDGSTSKGMCACVCACLQLFLIGASLFTAAAVKGMLFSETVAELVPLCIMACCE